MCWYISGNDVCHTMQPIFVWWRVKLEEEIYFRFGGDVTPEYSEFCVTQLWLPRWITGKLPHTYSIMQDVHKVWQNYGEIRCLPTRPGCASRHEELQSYETICANINFTWQKRIVTRRIPKQLENLIFYSQQDRKLQQQQKNSAPARQKAWKGEATVQFSWTSKIETNLKCGSCLCYWC